MGRGKPLMFTVDKEDDSFVITSLDGNGAFADVEVIMDVNEVYLRQWDENWQEYSVLVISHQQLNDIRTAIREI
jgi:hypothetical protein